MLKIRANSIKCQKIDAEPNTQAQSLMSG